MDWLRVLVAAYMVLLVLSAAASILMIGRKREVVTPRSALLSVIWSTAIFVTFAVVWERLG